MDYSRVVTPTIMVANPTDHVVSYAAAAARFLQFSPHAPKVMSCITTSEHPHCIASELLSPSTVDAIADEVLQFVLLVSVNERAK